MRLQQTRQLRAAYGPDVVQFHDRSVVCRAALADYLGFPRSQSIHNELRRVRTENVFESRVLFLKNLGFVTPSEARRITYEQTVRFEQIHERVYRELGFELTLIDPGSISARVEQIKRTFLPPNSMKHETFGTILKKGAQQQLRACQALSEPAKLRDSLAGWFPGRKLVGTPRLSPCILSSHRIFSVMHYGAIPVRDYASLSRLLEGGVISIATGEDPSNTLVQRIQLTAGDRVSAKDLDDYLSPDAKYFKMFAPFMRQVSRLVTLKSIAIAYETYVYQMDLNDWMENLERTGAKRLPDERRPLKVPLTMERVLAESNAEEGAGTSQTEN